VIFAVPALAIGLYLSQRSAASATPLPRCPASLSRGSA